MGDSKKSISITKLNGLNYPSWRFIIEKVIKNRKLQKVTFEEVKQENVEANADKETEAQELLANSLESNIVTKVLTCNTAHQIWVRLESIYQLKGEGNIESLLTKFWSIKMTEEEEMASWIGRVEELASEIKSSGEEISDRALRAKLIGGLTSRYDGFARAWNATTQPERTLTKLIDRLIQDENIFREKEDTSKSKTDIALYSKNRKNPIHSTNSSYESRSCNYCHKKGHLIAECRKRLYNNTKESRQPNLQNSHQKSKGAPYNKSNDQVAFMTLSKSESSKSWFADSGASAHMAKDIDDFHSYRSFNVQKKIILGDKSFIYAHGSGKVSFNAELPNNESHCFDLEDVLYVPSLTVNLVSISTATSKGISINFTGNSCDFIYNSRIILTGNIAQGNNLFKLNITPVRHKSNAQTALFAKTKRTIHEWHKALGHVNVKEIERMAKQNLVDGMNLETEEEPVVCSDCPRGKATHSKHPTTIRNEASEVGEIAHADLIGPIKTASIGHSKYILLITDERSSYRQAYPLKSKTEVVAKLQDYFIMVENDTGHRVKTLRCDNGSEFVNREVELLLRAERIIMLNSAPYTPQQNGLAERSNRTLIEAVRTMINASKLPVSLWAEAANAACFALNRTSNSRNDKTPFEHFYSRKPDVSNIVEFGKQVQLLQEDPSGKWSSKTVNGNIVGFTRRRNTYRCYIPASGKVIVTSNVILCDHTTDKKPTQFTIIENLTPNDETSGEIDLTQTGDEETGNDDSVSEITLDESSGPVTTDSLSKTTQATEEITATENTEPTGVVTRSRSKLLAPIKEKLRNLSEEWDERSGGASNFFRLNVAHEEPFSFQSALSGNESIQWSKAIDEELESLKRNQTWSICDLPKGHKPISTKWVFKRKTLPDGSIDKFKARLVARGFDQQYGVNYFDTYSTVVRHETIRLFFALCVMFNLAFIQFDVITAFLNGVLDEEVYLSPPQGVDCPKNKVLKLHRSIYGLKQSPRCWQMRLKKILSKFNMSPTTSDPSLFIGDYEGVRVMMIIYVDDGIIASSNRTTLQNLLDNINKEIKLKIVDSDIFVGFEIMRHSDSITLHQTSYIDKMLYKFNMRECKAASVPINDVNNLMLTSDNDDAADAPYRELMGALNYASCLTRPDITYAVNCLSKFNNNPKTKHWVAAKTILRYLSGTKPLGINFHKQGEIVLQCYSDADWGGDLVTRRSTSGGIIELCGGPIIYKSKQQSIIASSTTESEYIAANMLVKDLAWLTNLLGEIDLRITTNLFVDNQAAIHLITSDHFRPSTKHIDIKYHYIREKYNQKLFNLNYINTNEQKADLFTKAMSSTKFNTLKNLLGLTLVIAVAASATNSLVTSQIQHQDPVIWMKTPVVHIDGYLEYNIKFVFIDPCQSLFSNLTGIATVDNALTDTCSNRFQKDIINNIRALQKSSNRTKRFEPHLQQYSNNTTQHELIRTKRDGGVTAILALSALYVAGYSAYSNREAAQSTRRELTFLLEERISLLQEKFILASTRISTRLNAIEKDVHFLGELSAAQPAINDAMNQATMKMHDDKIKIMSLNESLIVGSPVPTTLLELFNMTNIASQTATKHSRLLAYSIHDDQIHVSLLIPTLSKYTTILKAEAFNYRAIVDKEICDHFYVGPPYVLFNSSSRCVRPLANDEIVANTVIGKGCRSHAALTNTSLFEPKKCRTLQNLTISQPTIQLKHDGQRLRINCQERKIVINNTQYNCPNYIFSLEAEKPFSIDDYTYKYSTSRISDVYGIEIPDHINLHLGMIKDEFHSLTADEIEDMQKRSKELMKKNLSDQMDGKSEKFEFPDVIGGISKLVTGLHEVINQISGYVVILIIAFICYIMRRGQQNRPNAPVNVPLMTMAIILVPMFLCATTAAYRHEIRIQATAEQSTLEIARLQQHMNEKACDPWILSRDYGSWTQNEGQYAVTVSCALAKLNITCPCDASEEIVPIVPANKLRHVENYPNEGCPAPNRTQIYSRQLEMFTILSNFLCFEAHVDSWSREHYGQLLASACILSRKAYNCHCHGTDPHKNIFRDLLTIKATQSNLTSRAALCTKKQEELFENSIIEENTIYARFHQGKI